MNGDVLFFDFAFLEYLPIIEESARRGVRPIMNQPPMREALAKRGTAATGFADFVEPGDAEYAASAAQALGERFVSAISTEGAAAAFESSRGNLLANGGRDLVQSVLSMAQNQILITRILNRLVRTTDLRAIVMRACISAGQRVIQAVAEQRGIPVIEIAHGNRCLSTDPSQMNVPWHAAVFGERQRDLLLSCGSDPAHVHVTGAPQWDVLYAKKNRLSKQEARAKLGLPLDRQLIVYCGSFSSGENLWFADAALVMLHANQMFVESLSKLESRPSVIVRPHPGEWRQKPGRQPTSVEAADYKQWFEARGIHIAHIDFSAGSLVREKAALIRAADVVVTHYSTLPTEIMILDRPCIILAPGTPLFPSFYKDSDGVKTVHSAAELTDQLSRILGDPAYEASLRDAARATLPVLNHHNGGEAYSQLVDVIIDVADSARA